MYVNTLPQYVTLTVRQFLEAKGVEGSDLQEALSSRLGDLEDIIDISPFVGIEPKLDVEKAKEWCHEQYAGVVEVDEWSTLFSDLTEAFQYIYQDENDSWLELQDTISLLSEFNLRKVVEDGFDTLAEYLAYDWEWLVCTPYGYLKTN